MNVAVSGHVLSSVFLLLTVADAGVLRTVAVNRSSTADGRDPHQDRIDELRRRLEEASHNRAEKKPYRPDLNGDISCMRWIGGICHVTGCFTSRGPTDCIDGKCMCQSGTCAMEDGTCRPAQGKKLGAHSISFANPAKPSEPYIGIDTSSFYELPTTPDNLRKQNTYLLKSTSTSMPLWNIAVTPTGYVRFESKDYPGYVMMVYFNQDDPQDTYKSDTIVHSREIPHNYEIWPVAVPFDQAVPTEITFQVRPTQQNGGGLEIWHPQSDYVLASIDVKNSIVNTDLIEKNGIAECADTNIRNTCMGRQLVQFSPSLPADATPSRPRQRLYPSQVYPFWMMLLAQIIFCGVFGVLVAGGAVVFSKYSAS